MSLVVVQNVFKSFGAQSVLEDVSLEIHAGETVGLVGANGAGKTTLFRLIAGETQPDLGTVERSREAQVGFLRQDPEFSAGRALREEVARVFDSLLKLERKMQEMSEAIASAHDDPSLPELMAAYDRVHGEFVAAGGHEFETRIHEILGAMGFSRDDYGRPMAAFSGGQKSRAALAKLLLEDKPLLLLDEPTNHLDIDAVSWLEKVLARHRGAALIISHDRYFLDRLCTRIVEIEDRRAFSFPGNYANYAATKARLRLTQQREFDKHQAFIQKERKFIAQHLAGQRSRQAKGRRTRLQRQLDAGEFVTQAPTRRAVAKISFRQAGLVDSAALRCDDLAVGFGDKVLIRGLSFQLSQGEHLCITGPNGTGKTTLLRAIVGEVAPLHGTVERSPRATLGYFAQAPPPFDPERTVVEQIRSAGVEMDVQRARTYLARFLFRGDEVFKPLKALSGGERSRLRLALLILEQPDVLILDEPTNHLDIPSREVLEEALVEFQGALLAVSHDRYFVDRMARRLLIINADGHRLFAGNYSAYQAQIEREAAEKESEVIRKHPKARAAASAPPSKRAEPSPYDRLSIDELEEMVMAHETKLAALHERFGDPRVYKNPDVLAELQEEIEAVSAELAEVEAAWQQRVELQ